MKHQSIWKILSVCILTIVPQVVNADFFKSQTTLIENNYPRLSYGIAVTDFDGDGLQEFIVSGFGYPNLALRMVNKRFVNVVHDALFADAMRNTIGVAACDVNGDGKEELYFLNTDTYSGTKKLGDRLLGRAQQTYDLFELKKNQSMMNLTAGRSVACVDRLGNGK